MSTVVYMLFGKMSFHSLAHRFFSPLRLVLAMQSMARAHSVWFGGAAVSRSFHFPDGHTPKSWVYAPVYKPYPSTFSKGNVLNTVM